MTYGQPGYGLSVRADVDIASIAPDLSARNPGQGAAFYQVIEDALGRTAMFPLAGARFEGTPDRIRV